VNERVIDPPSSPAPAPAGSLSERVKTLRLPAVTTHSRRGGKLPWALAIVLGGLLLYLVLRPVPAAQAPDKAASAPPIAAADGPEPTPPPANVAASGDIVLESKGYIVAVHQIQVSPKVAGMVIKLSIEEGKRVKQGDVLAELETIDYLADRDRAKATLDSAKQHLLELERGNRPEEIQAAKADLEECEAQREQLYLDWKRNLSLKRDNALAPKDYEQAYSAYKAMDRHVARLRENYKLMVEGPRQEKIDAARAELAQAQADLAKAQWRLDNCIVRAPVSGTILTKKTEEGSIVNPIAFNVAASLCDMADLSDLEVDLNIQERDVAKVFRTQICRIRPDAFPERTYEGSVSRLMPIADRAKGAVPVRVKVRVPKDEEGVYLKPEMSAVVSFLKKETSSK
jgi:multidrug resistance efflux pump